MKKVNINSVEELIKFSQTLEENTSEERQKANITIPTKVWEEVLEKNGEYPYWVYEFFVDEKGYQRTMKTPCSPDKAKCYMGCLKRISKLFPYKYELVSYYEGKKTGLKPVWITPNVSSIHDITDTIKVSIEVVNQIN